MAGAVQGRNRGRVDPILPGVHLGVVSEGVGGGVTDFRAVKLLQFA